MQNRDPTTITPDTGGVSLSANRPSDFSEIIDIQVPKNYEYVFPSDRPLELFVFAHEQFSHDGTTTTYSLSHDLVDSPSLSTAPGTGSGRHDLVLYEDGTQVSPSNVDYANDTFEYDGGAAATLDVYYVWDASSQINARWESTNGEEHKRRFSGTVSQFHTAKTFSRQQDATFNNRFRAKEKEHVRFFINTDVDLTNWDALDGDGPNGSESYSWFRIPVYTINK